VICSSPRSVKVYISLVNDVRGVAEGALEHLGELENRRRHVLVAVERRDTARVSITARWRRISSGKISWVPRTGCSEIKERPGGVYWAAARRQRVLPAGLDLRRLLFDERHQMIDDVGVLEPMIGRPFEIDHVRAVAAAGEADVGFRRLARAVDDAADDRDRQSAS